MEVGGAGGELLCEINAGLSLKPDVHAGGVRVHGCSPQVHHRVHREGETRGRKGGPS